MKIKNTAFTLIELLVVIVIIGILATISVSTFSGFFEKARLAKAQQSASQIKSLFLAQNASTEENLFTSWFSFDGPNDVNASSPFLLDRSEAQKHITIASNNPFSQSTDTGIGAGESLQTNKASFWRHYDGVNWPTDKITMATWIKISDYNGNNFSYFMGLFGRVRFSIYKNGKINFDIGSDAGGNSTEAFHSPQNLIKKDKWHYIIGSFDGNIIRIFVDGDLVASKEKTTHNDFNSGIHIGQSGAYPFNGFLDEVMIMPYGFDGKELK